MTDQNPYAAPQSRPRNREGRSRLALLIMALRALAVVGGFSFLAGPTRSTPSSALSEGHVAAKSFGAILLIVAFFPFGENRRKFAAREVGHEEL